jgi:hypothetical protein
MIQSRLPLTDAGRDALASARFRAACKVVAKELGYKAVADAWGCDEATVSLKLDEKNRNSMHPCEVISLKRLDSRGIIRAAEDAELDDKPSAEKIVARLPGVLRRYFTDDMAETVETDLGMR